MPSPQLRDGSEGEPALKPTLSGSAGERRTAGHAGQWFHHGVHAIACVVTPKPPEAYVCPLCLNFFTSARLDGGRLTKEHVPPKAVGGKPLVLTCLSCNNASGSLLDEAMADDEKLRTFGRPYTLARTFH